MRISTLLLVLLSFSSAHISAEILPQAQVGIKIQLAKKPSTRPMTVAYVPTFKNYYIADGGLAPMASEFEAPTSKSEIHAYTAEGKYVNSAKPGYDNRSIYFNPTTKRLETITYNISSAVGFSPNSGIYGIDIAENGEIKNSSVEVMQFNPAFGHEQTMPSFDADSGKYYAKQGRSNKVWIVDPKSREKIGEISLDFTKANVAHDDVSDHFVAYTGVSGEEFLLLDVDHKSVLIFNLKGEYVGKSGLPADLKMRSQNHFNGLGYANQMLFVYQESEGEFGTYYGFKVQK